MSTIVALFGEQSEATQVADALANLNVEMEVFEAIDSESKPFGDADLGHLNDYELDYLADRVRRGAVVMVVEAADDLIAQVSSLFQQNNAQVYQGSR